MEADGVINSTRAVHGSINQVSTQFVVVESPQDLLSLVLTNPVLQKGEVDSIGLVQARYHLLPSFEKHLAEQSEGVGGGLRVSGLLPTLVVGLGQVGVIVIPPHGF